MKKIYWSSEEESAHIRKRAPVSNQRAIDRLVNLGTISNEQYCAAMQLAKDYYLANCHHHLKARGFVIASKGQRNYNQDYDIDARRRFEIAKKLLTVEEWKVVEWVVVDDKYLKYYVRDESKTRAQSLADSYGRLRMALEVLGKHYGYIKPYSHKCE